MEEDVGIFDAEGLPAYASYFRDALVLGVAIEANGAFGGADTTVLFLVFQYAIGSALLEGRMKVKIAHCLVQRRKKRNFNFVCLHTIQMKLAQESICLDVYSMMKLIYNFDPLRKVRLVIFANMSLSNRCFPTLFHTSSTLFNLRFLSELGFPPQRASTRLPQLLRHPQRWTAMEVQGLETERELSLRTRS